MTDAEIYELKEEARRMASFLYQKGPQWTGKIASNIEAFAEGAAWHALSYSQPEASTRSEQPKTARKTTG